MMDGFSKRDDSERDDRDDIYSNVVRAGKRTYFFDVKATRQNDYYLTITESKKKIGRDGGFFFEKHKIFLYKEDFDKFAEGFTDAVDYIKANNEQKDSEAESEPESKAEATSENQTEEPVAVTQDEFSSISFDDLGEK